MKRALFLFVILCSACQAISPEKLTANHCNIELIVLGVGQDAGAPQIGNSDDPAWQDNSKALLPTSLAILNHQASKRILFEATPAITQQVQRLNSLSKPANAGLGIDGIFLTHAHIGHYAGLMYLGREAAGASNIPVYAMPRFADYLRSNGPWDQLVALNNISIVETANQVATEPIDSIKVTPFKVPHRDEYSETVGFIIETDGKDVLFLPDIDSWEELELESGIKIENLTTQVDYAFIDATFFDDNELPGRDMSLIPHPRVTDSMDRFQSLADDVKARIYFTHVNHTNPIRFTDSEASKTVLNRGFSIAREGQRICLSN